VGGGENEGGRRGMRGGDGGSKNLALFRAVRDVINRGVSELIGSPVMAKGIVFSS